MKITEDNLNEIIDLLNDLICDENLLTRTERLDLVRAVAAIGGDESTCCYSVFTKIFVDKKEWRKERKERKGYRSTVSKRWHTLE
ncbi:Uncharacterised protein [Klebsiella oxytoca]|nr:Uncharacterised protein [Klebsiella oxytoca]